MCGAETVVRGNGVLAVEAFCAAVPGTYDAILMDIQMPEMDGYAAARTIRSNKRADAKTIPIIAMTANAFEEDVEAALEAGMDAHIAKPVDIGILWATLGKLVGMETSTLSAGRGECSSDLRRHLGEMTTRGDYR